MCGYISSSFDCLRHARVIAVVSSSKEHSVLLTVVASLPLESVVCYYSKGIIHVMF